MVNFFIILILHIIGDFYLQTSKIAKCKSARLGDSCDECKSCKKNASFNIKYILLHSLLYVAPFAFLFLMTKWLNVVIILVGLLISHFVIDIISCCLNKKFKHSIVFIADQALHISLLWGAYILFDFNGAFAQYEFAIKVVFSVLAITIPSSVFINKIFHDLYPDSDEGKIFDVGSIIGMLERILALIFAYFEGFAAIAIIITIKTWARSGDLQKSDVFRNKYLLGTLASLVLALTVFLVYKL